ncbi:MAG: hypothetical protein ABL931_01585 [Usitatibacteraceae bacterium]
MMAISVFALIGNSLVHAQGAPAPGRETVQQRLGAVSTLVETSSGAKQVESSGNPAAQSKRAAARVLWRAAENALRSGDHMGASGLLDEAAKTMFDAVRLAAPEQVTAGKERRDFDARMESTEALLVAQKRIVKEKGIKTSEVFIREAEDHLRQASALATGGELKSARAILDQAYLAVKAAVRGMRSGDTLVRSLNFANKEEEYRYELDRNDTHLMLVNMLLTEKRAAASVDTMVQRSLEVAAQHRKVGEVAAGKRDFDGGVRALEDSTRELVRAIRGAGVYIPG